MNTSSCRNTFSHLARASMLHFYIIHFVYFASYFSCYVIISPFGASLFVDIFLSFYFFSISLLPSISISLSLPIYLSGFVSICLSIYLPRLDIYLFIHQSICMHINISVSFTFTSSYPLSPPPPTFSLSVYLSISFYFFLSLSLSVCLSTYPLPKYPSFSFSLSPISFLLRAGPAFSLQC